MKMEAFNVPQLTRLIKLSVIQTADGTVCVLIKGYLV